MFQSNKVLICLVLILAVVVMTGCEPEGPMERVGSKIDEATEEAGEAIEDAVEKVEDKVEEKKD